MQEFKNIQEIRDFLQDKGISFKTTDRKEALLDKVKAWEAAQEETNEETEVVDEEEVEETEEETTEEKTEEVKKEVPKDVKGEFTGAEFGQLYQLEKVGIKYLTKVFGNEKKKYKAWIKICKDKKVID